MSSHHDGIIANRTRVIIIYPTVHPEVVIVPIVSSILVFPFVALLVICCLRHRAARARQKARLAKRDMPFSEQSCASIARCSPPHSSQGTSRRFPTINIEADLTTTIELLKHGEPKRFYCGDEAKLRSHF
ncbi:unnamed protein product [Allacma fusca]|uniref:Uncharacterized protein n=1 Tax=Allacma fusca TaxID=39272 RepID=A0A8J2PWR4_9HEXA|nr:unnamed protein product [Allacma fusca]